MGLFVTPERMLRFGRRRVAFLLAAVPTFVVTEVVRRGLRPGLQSEGGVPLTIANSIGNLGGVVVQILLSLAIINPTRRQAIAVVGFITTGYVAYEFLQPILPKGTFDWNDVIATLVGGLVIALPLVLIACRVHPEDGD